MTRVPRRTVLRGGTVVDGVRDQCRRVDVAIASGRIRAVGEVDPAPGDDDVDCTGRLLLPGFIDAHSHADAVLFDDDVQLALLRQGITTVVGGQDGVSFAPGDGAWASSYFAAIDGAHPTYRGDGVAGLLATYEGTTRLNAAYLVPAGTVRHEVMGMADRPADVGERRRMRALVEAGLADGAVGLSTGLDYVPGIFADAAELADLCRPVAAVDGLYVTHMRGGYERNSAAGLDEIARIVRDSGVSDRRVRAHVSHLHLDADDAWRLLEEHAADGIDLTFDMYPYTRGCTLVAMAVLPPAYSALDVETALAHLDDPAERARLDAEWFPQVADKPSLGPDWPDMITIAHTPSGEWAWAAGRTLAEIARRRATSVAAATLDLIVASRLQATAVMAVRDERSDENLARLFSHPGFVGGSDGIFIGAVPHPRAHGAFARYLARFTGDDRTFTWSQIAQRLSGRTAALFGLGARGALRPGWRADIVVVDPDAAADRATYARPTVLAEGIDDVFVGGTRVLAGGALTHETPGTGIRRRSATADLHRKDTPHDP